MNKTIEQIIESYMSFNANTGRSNERPLKVYITSAMQEYSDQQLREYKEKLKAVIDNHKSDYRASDVWEHGVTEGFDISKRLIDSTK
jgi:hypothetical protein